MPTERRIETDGFGPIEVPAGAYWGASTERARRNFQISGLRLPSRFLGAIALIKCEAAVVNRELGVVAPEIADAIVAAAQEIVDGRHSDQFPLDVVAALAASVVFDVGRESAREACHLHMGSA